MKRLVFIFLLWTTLTASADGLIFMTGEKLLTYCNNADNASLDRGICDGFLTGVMDTATTVNALRTGYLAICPTIESSPFFMRNAFLLWADKHPEDLKTAAASIVISAYLQEFPCRN